jgi:tetratricopeptide (TPR) repeat protein
MSTKSENLTRAVQHHQAGRLREAEEIYRQLLQLGSSDATVWCYLGSAQLNQGKVAEAEVSYRKALELRPHMAEAHADLGIALAHQGRLEEAAASLRQAIQMRPHYPEALCNLAVIANQLKRPTEAIAHLEQALNQRPDYPEAYNNLGTVYQGLSRLPEAIGCYRRALEIRPGYAQAQGNLQLALRSAGLLAPAPAPAPPPPVAPPPPQDVARAQNVRGIDLAQQGRHDEAIVCFREAIRLRPGYTDAINNLGNIFYFQNKFDEAVECYEQVLRLAPEHVGAHSNLGEVVRQQGKLKEALEHCERAVELQPDFAQGQTHLGLALSSNERFEEALPHFETALRLAPNLADAHHGLGYAMLQLRRVDDAIGEFEAALRLKPDLPDAHSNLGSALVRQGKYDEAMAHFRDALHLKPTSTDAHLHQAHCLWQLGRFEEAAASAQEALRLKPESPEGHNVLGVVHMKAGRPAEAIVEFTCAAELRSEFAQAHFNRGLAYLLQGDYRHGWPDYEWRWRCRDFVTHPIEEAQGWDGTPLAGRTILLHAEQGMGDALQFIRFAPQVKRQGGSVIVACAPPLMPLLSRCAGVDRVVDNRDLNVKFDVEAPLLSLPGKLGTTLETIPAEVPYLSGDPALEEHWRKELSPFAGFKIGIAWQGNRDHPEDRLRSVPLERFAGLTRDGVQLISLQLGAGREQIDAVADRLPVADVMPRSEETPWTFLDTAAVIKNLNLVVTVDTSVAHLAGGLGVPVWLALAYAPDWRWLLEREDSPWYPTARLFRQKRFGDWADVFYRMGRALRQLVA